MSIQVETHVVGLKELKEVLLGLPKELVANRGATNAVASALMAAALPVLRAAQSEAPQRTGRLMKAIKRRRHPRPKYLNEIVGVGVDPGRSREDPNGAWYGYIVHARNPFLKRAFQRTQGEALQRFRKVLATKLEAAAKKAGDDNARAIAAKVKNL